jgi:hypothetical protein
MGEGEEGKLDLLKICWVFMLKGKEIGRTRKSIA